MVGWVLEVPGWFGRWCGWGEGVLFCVGLGGRGVCVGRWVGDFLGCCGLLGGCRECGGCVSVVCGECAQVCLARVCCGWC